MHRNALMGNLPFDSWIDKSLKQKLNYHMALSGGVSNMVEPTTQRRLIDSASGNKLYLVIDLGPWHHT